jgi:hypothetical protein
MNRVFSNGPSKDFVINPFQTMVYKSAHLWIAAPYVTETDELVEAASSGKSVYLLAGLNASTSPQALAKVHGAANCEVRYFTRRFHAKIYLFDTEALVGSSNLTDGGLRSNREATICLYQADDLDELRTLFNELWESALLLTTEKLRTFTEKVNSIKKPDLDVWIEDAVGKAEPVNISVGSSKRTAVGIFFEGLRRQVQQYGAAFGEVSKILEENHFQRIELQDAGPAIEANRFLNWVRLTHAPGDEAWELAPDRTTDERFAEVVRLGKEWSQAEQSAIPVDYLDWLKLVRAVFGSRETIEDSSQEQLTEGLLAIHAFNEQLRFVKGGLANLPTTFWHSNGNDLAKVKRTLTYLVHGNGDFVERLHEVLYTPSMKLAYFGMFCALELYGTIKPEVYPPINGRMAKALRYLGYGVRGA